MRRLTTLAFCLTLFLASEAQVDMVLKKVRLPMGFSLKLFADDLPNARSMSLADDGTIFVGTRGAGNVYAVRDEDGDGRAEKKYVIDQNLNYPNGVAFRNGDLYVAEIDRILIYRDISRRLADPPEPEVLYDQYPSDRHHGWKYIAFGSDGWLYVPVGAPCNICEPEEDIYCTITRFNPENKKVEIYAKGVRNSVGFDWSPVDGKLWFTDNGRDHLGDNQPCDELNRVVQQGQHFGYPYCHQGDISDPEYGSKKPCSMFEAPKQKLNPHGASLGMKFYEGDMFPEEYKNQIFLCEHGSWNRSEKIGYRVSLVRVKEHESLSYEGFAEGFLQPGDEVIGRPVDVLELPDGSVLISDDYNGAIYRITYTKSIH
jgi:glucose/arabinose dehydrogenase